MKSWPFIRKWNFIFIVSCVFAVSMDPLFLYIPVIDNDIKCVGLDNNLKIAALVSRSVTDLCYLLNIFFQVYSSFTNSSNFRRPISFLPNIASTILIDILAILPIPQIIILIFYFKMRSSRSFDTWKLVMNIFVPVQYVPRVFRIYLSCKQYSKKYSSREEIPTWLKGVFNFFLYILASHVIGAFWYFFAIQQIITCWQYACRPKNGCVPSNLYCHDHHALKNIKFLDDLCSVDPPNEKLFNFGIFLDILQLGILGQANYFDKLSNCFGWGLRNLSSFGSNLKPSINGWENVFANFISVIGLLLFLYLIGNLQTYMQLDTTRLEAKRWKMKNLKIEAKDQEVEKLLSKAGIPSSKKSEIKSEIMMKVKKVQLKQNKEVDVENILSTLPSELQSYMESCMPLNRLKQVPLLQNMNEDVLIEISKYLKPKKYTKNDIIIQEKKPLEMMIFIMEGLVIIEMRDCDRSLKRSYGEVYGEKLLIWPAWTSFPSLPIATESARADGDVEALVLTASDIQDNEWLRSKLQSYFVSKEIAHLTDDDWKLLDRVPMLRKVPLLQNMDERVLRAISEYLKPKKYTENAIIIQEKQPLDMMFFIVEGLVIIEKRECSRKLKRSAGEVYGEKLFSWPAWSSFPSCLPIATESVTADGDVEALVLMANDIREDKGPWPWFQSYILSQKITRLTDDEWELLEIDLVTMLRKVPKLETMNSQVLKAISEKIKPMSSKAFLNNILEGKPLRKMVFVTRGSMYLKKYGAWTNEKPQFYGEELLDWVLDVSFPAIVPISTHGVWAHNADVLVLMANDLAGVVSNFKSHFSKITIPTDDYSLDLCAFVGLTWLKKGPIIFQGMDEEVLKVICKHLKLMSFSEDTYILQENNPLEYMFILIDQGSSMSIECTRRPFERRSLDIGEIFGDELVPWVTSWAWHATFPDKLPLSTSNVKVLLKKEEKTSNVKVGIDHAGNAIVLSLWVGDLKSIVSKYRWQFINQTTLRVDFEGKVSTTFGPLVSLSTTFDPLATLKMVPKLEHTDEIMLNKFCTKLIPMSYNDKSPYIIEGELDKMFLIVSGLVSITRIKDGAKVYRYSGNYWGDELFEWALDPSRAYNHSLPKSDVCVEAVGDVEVLLLRANDLIRLVSESEFLKETGDDDINSFVTKKRRYRQLDTKIGNARIQKKMDKKGREVEWWLTKNGIPLCKQSEIMDKALGKLEENKDVDVENILSTLPSDLQSYMKSCMPLNRLKQVPLLQNMDENVLREISEYLVPKKYTRNEIIIREKEPLQMMIFIVEGCVIIKKRNFPSTLKRSAGEVYGEKLLSWPAWTSFPTLPIATESVGTDDDVEALVLMVTDMQEIGWKFQQYFFSMKITHLTDDEWEILESARVTMLRKVPKLETMDIRVLKTISENLKPMSCKAYMNIIREGKPLRKMVFVTKGSISLKKDGARTNEKRQFYGEELLDWVLDRSFPAIVPISTHGVWVHFNTDVLVLMANDLGGVVSKFKSHFRKEITSPSDDSLLDLCAIVGLTWLKKGPSIFRHMDEEVLKVISKHLKLMNYRMDTYIVRENKPLEYMFIFVDGCTMSIESTRRPIERGLHNIGKFYGEELVHWVTNWASHATFPDKLPLSTSNVKLRIDDTGNARVLVLCADDLKSIVSKFRLEFIKQTTLPVDSECQLSMFDPLATLKKVPQLEGMDQTQLEEIRRSLISMRYNDMSPYIIDGDFDKMFLIVSGLVSVTSLVSIEKVYRYSGNYCGDELLKRVLHPSRASKSTVWVEAVGEVEALVLGADDLIRLVSQFNRSGV